MDPDLDAPATKRDLAELKTELKTELNIFRKEIAEDIARSAQVMMEHMTDLFRAATDQTRSVGDRLADHVADATVHRARRKAR